MNLTKIQSCIYPALIIAMAILAGCEEVDNQLITPESRKMLVNPPTDLSIDSIKSNNAHHKIIMAVIDSGVDYNHPLLQKHIHFELNPEGNKIQGSGYDFIGDDSWPSPYVARTADIDPEVTEESRTDSISMKERMSVLQDQYPMLAKFFESDRAIEQEIVSGSYHGTHVAGLMVYDTPELGLIPYRVLPTNKIYKNGSETSPDAELEIIKYIGKALDDAAAKHARVINLSLGMNHARGEDKDITDLEFIEKSLVIEKFAKAHPEIAIVAAAGNEGAWVDLKSRRQLPCGVRAANVLCVGAIDNTDQIASFSNLILTETPTIYTSGSNIWSTFPTKMCNTDAFNRMMIEGIDEAALNGLVRDCQKPENKYLIQLSGTSMASPIAAHLIALEFLREPEMDGAQAIQSILSRAEDFKLGPMALKKIRAEKPSWYAAVEKSLDRSFEKRKNGVQGKVAKNKNPSWDEAFSFFYGTSK